MVRIRKFSCYAICAFKIIIRNTGLREMFPSTFAAASFVFAVFRDMPEAITIEALQDRHMILNTTDDPINVDFAAIE